MSVSEKVKGVQQNNAGTNIPNVPPTNAQQEPVNESNRPPQTPPAQSTGTSKSKGKNSVAHDRFIETGASYRNNYTAEQKALEGSKSDKVEFICALGDPAKPTKRTEGGDRNIPTYAVVGYKFKVLEDCTVPNSPLLPNFSTLLDTGDITEVPAKAGDIVILNVVETSIFINKLEYAGSFTGGGTGVRIQASFASDRPEPRPILKFISGKGSVKSNIELIADMVGNANNGKGVPKIKPEYAEKFSVLYQPRSAGNKDANLKDNSSDTANLAAAFRALYAKKRTTPAQNA